MSYFYSLLTPLIGINIQINIFKFRILKSIDTIFIKFAGNPLVRHMRLSIIYFLIHKLYFWTEICNIKWVLLHVYLAHIFEKFWNVIFYYGILLFSKTNVRVPRLFFSCDFHQYNFQERWREFKFTVRVIH